jgi:co-chaperonin GroES (HSP10)
MTSTIPLKGEQGWRAHKGPQTGNKSGFRATGHRLLLKPDEVEKTTESGIILTAKTIDQEKSVNEWATVIEIGYECWSDKSTDYCDVGDRVLVGKYSGKFHISPVDGVEYRFLSDLDVITPLVEVSPE